MLKFHPEPGTILICDYSTGFRLPEMVKKRPVVTISPRLKRRDGLITVVPLSVSCLLLPANSTKAQVTGSLVIGRPMMSMIAEHIDEVRVRRYSDVPECDVVVAVRGLEMSLRCRDYNQAVKWARIECKFYKIAGGFTVMPKVRKNAPALEAIVRAEAARVIGPWPIGLRMLIYPLGDNWRATFSLEHLGLADYRDDVLPIVLRLRNEFDIIEL